VLRETLLVNRICEELDFTPPLLLIGKQVIFQSVLFLRLPIIAGWLVVLIAEKPSAVFLAWQMDQARAGGASAVPPAPVRLRGLFGVEDFGQGLVVVVKDVVEELEVLVYVREVEVDGVQGA
jgi:hypothetical protein